MIENTNQGSPVGERRTPIPPPQGEEQARLQRSRAGQKGGEHSAQVQRRDSFGQFAGRDGQSRAATPPSTPATRSE